MSDQQISDTWIGKTYQIQGSWSIQDAHEKQYFVLEDDFRTNEGPDLKVYLNRQQMEEIGNRDAIDEEGIYLGELQSASGAQRYEIPQDIQLDDFQSIAIHCRRYSVVWGGVNLSI